MCQSKGYNDKRQVTGTFAVSLTGIFLLINGLQGENQALPTKV